MLRQSIGTTEDADIGAMSSESQLNIVEEHVDDAVKRGASVLAGMAWQSDRVRRSNGIIPGL